MARQRDNDDYHSFASISGEATAKINVVPNPVLKSSIRIDGSFDRFSVIWDRVTNVNYGWVSYRVSLKIDEVDMLVRIE